MLSLVTVTAIDWYGEVGDPTSFIPRSKVELQWVSKWFGSCWLIIVQEKPVLWKILPNRNLNVSVQEEIMKPSSQRLTY